MGINFLYYFPQRLCFLRNFSLKKKNQPPIEFIHCCLAHWLKLTALLRMQSLQLGGFRPLEEGTPPHAQNSEKFKRTMSHVWHIPKSTPGRLALEAKK